MHIQKISGLNLQKNSTSFNSRVVYELSQTPLSSSVKDFIDTFEERFPKQASGKRSAEKRYSNNGFTVFDIKSGESGVVYMIEPNNGEKKFVMKESFPLRYKSRLDSDLGGLKHEYRAMTPEEAKHLYDEYKVNLIKQWGQIVIKNISSINDNDTLPLSFISIT